MDFAHPVKRIFDRLLDAPGQTIIVGSSLQAFGRRFGFKARFTASAQEVQAVIDRKDTRVPVAQEMLRLNGIKNIFTQPDETAAQLKGLLKHRLNKDLNHEVASKIAAEVASRLQLAAQQASPAQISVDLFEALRPVVQLALLEAFLGRSLTPEAKAKLDGLVAAPVGIEGVSRVFGFALLTHALKLERILPKVFFGKLLGLCLPKVAATREHHRVFNAIVRSYVQPGSNVSSESWLGDVLSEFNSGRMAAEDFDGEIAAIYDTSYALALGSMWSILCVANSPEHQVKLRVQSQRIHEADGSTTENYARLCALEALRLYPPFYMLGYTASKTPATDAAKKSGCPMAMLGLRRPTMDTVVSVQGLHRNETYWHQADTFWPERFQGVSLDERKKTPKASYIPFGVGHRACPGRAVSMTVIERLLLTLFGSASPVGLELPAGMPKPKRNALLMAQSPQITVSLL